MSEFEEKKGVVPCKTPWGRWFQTVEDVQIEIDCKESTSGKEVKCKISPGSISCCVKGTLLFEGKLFGTIKEDDSTWTVEDKKLIRIILAKAKPDAKNCWYSLLAEDEEESYDADPITRDQMQKHLTLERFQRENPGMDFSGAEITGNYHDGGPVLPQ